MAPFHDLPCQLSHTQPASLLQTFPFLLILFACSAANLNALQGGVPPEKGKWNVLFIAVDDLRPELGCYGNKVVKSPNIDRLAERSLLLERAYCQQAVCSPSRLSMLTGRRPDAIGVWDLKTHFREKMPNAITLPQHFKNYGYRTRSVGKIFHGSGKPSQDPPSWSDPPLLDQVRDPRLRYALKRNLSGKGLKRSATESAGVPDSTYVDGVVCREALKMLDQMKNREQPFFLAVGFRKPHLPFCAPKKYWDLYDPNQIPAIRNPSHPDGAPEWAIRSWMELEGYTDIPKNGKLSREKQRELRHGYHACVSYIDHLVGRLLGRLEDLHLSRKTVVILWGDHGFHLGEQGLWTKANNYELSTRVPLLISIPGQTDRGIRSSSLVELLDLYPTLTDICGLPGTPGLQGTSLFPLVTNPEKKVKSAVVSQFPRSLSGKRHRGEGDIMGYALRTEHFRYVQWIDQKKDTLLAEELYDHRTDSGEMKNLLPQTGKHREIERLRNLLRETLSR